ncbi:pyruvate, phosphate dikinase [Halopolyspora algeriensis]|uniref:pyruvate, phosphate dikinase n=1 Tax=Halopolyspora algeriensis TaxID=1500506 RepID=UPI001FE4D3F9|nr:pyruvate, phosphate dikinase [Halopolyspora algeriensis]
MHAAPRVDAVLLDGKTGLSKHSLGGKAEGIERMLALGLPVPPAFVLSTGVYQRFRAESSRLPDDIWRRVRDLVHALERKTGRTFGGGARPLLVSVRSGAAMSMPGMMDTILNVGMTADVHQAFTEQSGDSGYAADVRRRFAEQFERTLGRSVPADPWEQLRQAIEGVFTSWTSPRAVAYRRDRGIADDAGTAVTVQAMVFGNVDYNSGSGVLFTRNPLTGGAEVYGEWIAGGQGEDVVSGRANAQPLSELAAQLPGTHRELMAAATRLERAGGDVQDIEFTVESGRLWLLQTRTAKRSPEAATRHAVAMVREGLIDRHQALDRIHADQVEALLRPRVDPQALTSARVVSRGKPASPGIGIGAVALDSSEVDDRRDRGQEVVLARVTTEPDDVPAMSSVHAVVTERGGATSHAAVVSREIAVPCVVGCGTGTVTRLAGRVVTVDGFSGVIYDGALPIVEAATAADSDLSALTEWARAESDAPAGADLLNMLRRRSSRRSFD